MATLTLIVPGTANASTLTGPAVAVPSWAVAADALVTARGGSAPCTVAIDGLIGGAWTQVGAATQGAWGEEGWGARIGVPTPLPTSLRARVIDCGGQRVGVAVELS